MRILEATLGGFTLKVSRALTFSCKVSAITRSNWVRTFMASCGSMRSCPINSSSASVKATPRLWGRGLCQPKASSCGCVRKLAANGTVKTGKTTFHDDTNRNSYLPGLPFCLVLFVDDSRQFAASLVVEGQVATGLGTVQ